jgi:hypothetical protein
MTTYHVIAAAGDAAEDLRSLGIFDAPSARLALHVCLGQLDRDPLIDFEHEDLRIHGVADLLRAECIQLRQALDEPDVSFIVVPTEAEAHLVRDVDGEIKDANEVERRRMQMRRDFGIDVV